MAGLVTLTESSADFSMTADIAGTLIPGVEILAPSRVQFDDDTGFTIDAAARAFRRRRAPDGRNRSEWRVPIARHGGRRSPSAR